MRSLKIPTVAILALTSWTLCSPARAQELQIMELPEIQLWCSQSAVPITADLSEAEEEAAVDAAKDAAGNQIDAALLAANVPYSGLPFVRSAQADPTPPAPAPGAPPPPPRQFRVNVCAAVGPGTPAPSAPLTQSAITASSYGVLRCGDLTDDSCVLALRNAMFERFGTDQIEVYESPILMTRAATGSSPAAIALAFQSGTDRATYRALTLSSTSGSGVPLEQEVERPMLLDSTAASIVTGIPVQGTAIVALPVPLP